MFADADVSIQMEINCLAQNIYHEARGEGFEGMLAVGNVTLNRLLANYRGKDTLCGVVRDYKQFSWVEKGRVEDRESEAWREALRASEKVLYGQRVDNTLGALHYYAPKRLKEEPSWAKAYQETVTINNHRFMK